MRKDIIRKRDLTFSEIEVLQKAVMALSETSPYEETIIIAKNLKIALRQAQSVTLLIKD